MEVCRKCEIFIGFYKFSMKIKNLKYFINNCYIEYVEIIMFQKLRFRNKIYYEINFICLYYFFKYGNWKIFYFICSSNGVCFVQCWLQSVYVSFLGSVMFVRFVGNRGCNSIDSLFGFWLLEVVVDFVFISEKIK